MVSTSSVLDLSQFPLLIGSISNFFAAPSSPILQTKSLDSPWVEYFMAFPKDTDPGVSHTRLET